MRRPMVAGNWKMNLGRSEASALAQGLVDGVDDVNNAEVLICPPYVHIADAEAIVSGSAVQLGAQNLSDQDAGAFTGEISGAMLKDYSCTHVIVGHSERRALYGETDELVAKKFAKAQEHGLIPVLCVGELLEEREAGNTESVVARQLDAVIQANGIAALENAIVAYEPVWAIGTGKTASPEQAQEVHAFIRNKLADMDSGIAEGLRILYGGSVKSSNAEELFSRADIDGGLIGGASLDAAEFLAICRAA
ncbi:MAG: triose-phosphate isomerase [Gammaproteobacteria bacterium]|nr:MAG: triose-phosphate isomerase [Gammaproteobacteria bacterium]RTZ62283.1 MAG: triose-phosphate isomerase [Gammaproteobacteria bacterium]